MNNLTSAASIAAHLNLNTRFIPDFDPKGYCPGFRLWKVTGTDGIDYLVPADDASTCDTVMYFHTRGAVSADSAPVLIGDNPDKSRWENARR